jgi:anti-sigma factor RsiW
MDCREAERFVELGLDGEIESSEGGMLETHLNHCTSCSSRYHVQGKFRAQIRSKLADAQSAERAPLGLRTRIVARVQEDEQKEGFSWGRAVAVTLGVSMVAVLSWSGTSGPSLFSEETVARHSGNLPPEVRADFEDPRSVQRFLTSNLRYPVSVPRFDRNNPSVKLVGARLSSLDDHDAAYVMYDRRGAKVSFFAYPKPERFTKPTDFREERAGNKVVLVGKRRGYNVVAWEEGELVYSLVSDIDPREMVELASGIE